MIRIYSLLLIGVLVVSSSAIFIRWAGDVSSPVIAFYRLFISGAILLVYYRIKHKNQSRYNVQFHWHFAIAGLFLALHFITWIASLKLTTIANAIFLESTHPFFAVIASIIFLKEHPNRKSYPIFLLALAGIFLIVSTDLDMQLANIYGDISAIFSALFFALYILIARLHRDTIHIIRYLGLVYMIAAMICLVFIGFRGDALTGFSDQSWLMLILLALGPSLLGHSLLNWSSRHLQIFKVNLTLLLEPVIATLAGILLFFEFPGFYFYTGGALIMLSLAYLVYLERKPRSS